MAAMKVAKDTYSHRSISFGHDLSTPAFIECLEHRTHWPRRQSPLLPLGGSWLGSYERLLLHIFCADCMIPLIRRD